VPPPFANATPSAVYNVASAPATMAVGQPLVTTSTITLDAGTTQLATTGLSWVSFNGTITTKPSATQAGLSLKVKKTTLGNGAAGTTVAPASGGTLAGTKLGAFAFKLGNMGTVVLNGFDAAGNKLGTVAFPTTGSFGRCINNAGTTPLLSGVTPVTTKVVKDTTKTTDKASYSARKDIAKATATVKSRFGTAATGKVTFTLKKGAKTLRSASDALNNKGVASVSFKQVKAKGTYSIIAKYAGSATLKGSTAKAVSFTVK
jgi:hypothetical protein